MTIALVGLGLMAICIAGWKLARTADRTQTVAEVLYDAQQPDNNAPK